MIHKRSCWLIFSAIIGLVISAGLGAGWNSVEAQLPPSNPLVAPLPAPSGPSQLQAPVQALSVPSLIAVPSPPPASPTPAARVFNCSCYGPSSGTHWMGQVSSTGVFSARQTATGACLTYNELKQPPPPALNLPEAASNLAASSSGAPVPPGFAPVNQAGTAASRLPGAIILQNQAFASDCSQCVCD